MWYITLAIINGGPSGRLSELRLAQEVAMRPMPIMNNPRVLTKDNLDDDDNRKDEHLYKYKMTRDDDLNIQKHERYKNHKYKLLTRIEHAGFTIEENHAIQNTTVSHPPNTVSNGRQPQLTVLDTVFTAKSPTRRSFTQPRRNQHATIRRRNTTLTRLIHKSTLLTSATTDFDYQQLHPASRRNDRDLFLRLYLANTEVHSI
jgi:hypothetical protein